MKSVNNEEVVFNIENDSKLFMEAKRVFKTIFPNSKIVSDLDDADSKESSYSWIEKLEKLDEFVERDDADDEVDTFYEEVIEDDKALIQMCISILISEDKTDYGRRKQEITSELYGPEYAVIREYENRDDMGYFLGDVLDEHSNWDLWFQIGWVISDYLCKKDTLRVDIKNRIDRRKIYCDEPFVTPLYAFQTILLPIVNMNKAIYELPEKDYFKYSFLFKQKFYHMDGVKDIPLNATATYFNLSFRNYLLPMEYIYACGIGIISYDDLVKYLFSVGKEKNLQNITFKDVADSVSLLNEGIKKIDANAKNQKHPSIEVTRNFLTITNKYMNENEQRDFIKNLYKDIVK